MRRACPTRTGRGASRSSTAARASAEASAGTADGTRTIIGGPHAAAGNNPRYNGDQVDFVTDALTFVRDHRFDTIEVDPAAVVAPQAQRLTADIVIRALGALGLSVPLTVAGLHTEDALHGIVDPDRYRAFLQAPLPG